jgi:alkyldihydroxyacetonephosphate synthase
MQQSLIRISTYHVKGAELVLGLSSDVITGALLDLGCNFWPPMSPILEGPTNFTSSSLSEAWSVTMQFGHLVAPNLKESQAFWADWLCPFKLTPTFHSGKSELIAKLVCSFEDLFDMAEGAVNQALQELQDLGICRLSRQHVVRIARRIQRQVPDELLHAYASMKVNDNNLPTQIDATFCPDLHVGNEDEELGMWGFKDSRFQVRPDSHGRPSVVMTGSRYGISGKPLKKLIPFIEGETKTFIDVYKEPVGITGLDFCECALSPDEVESIRDIVSRISIAAGARARHGTGHSHEEAYQLRRHGSLRVPDMVVWPSSEGEIQSLIEKAKECSWNLIPHGGGTNVSHATKCPAKSADPRPIISVDMTALKRIMCINEEDGIAHVEAGIIGRDLIEQLGRRGYTIGHEPDSLEFSTLGGWIATKASGMKRSKYGNIESIVVDIRVAGSAGLFWQGTNKDATTAIGRQSRGPDLLSLFLGSEGCLGIITSAVIRIWPTPPVQRYDSIIFRDFNVGLQFVQSVSKLGPFMPASVRLLDNAHFRLGQALREEQSFLQLCGKHVMKLLSPSFRSMSGDAMVCATMLFEGYEDEVRAQYQRIKLLATQYGGVFAGPGIGQSGYELTYVIAYLRDFALSFNFLGDSFETFAPWSKVKEVVTATTARIKAEHELRRLPGEVFVGCRVTQLYHDGACLYFYVCMFCGNINDASSVFTEIENSARQEILQHGGSLSHHHGVGKVRADFLQKMDSEALRDGLMALKRGFDPENIFGAGNGVFATS